MKRKVVLRRRDSAHFTSFDQQLWPIQAGLVVLAAFALGVARASTDWHEPGLFRNTAFWFVLISISVTAAMWWLGKLARERFRRTKILASILSLLLNLSVFVMLAWVQIFATLPNRDEPRHSRDNLPQDRLTLDFSLQVFEDPTINSLEQPVITAEPQASNTLDGSRDTSETLTEAFTAPTDRTSGAMALAFETTPIPRREPALIPRESPTSGPLRRDREAHSQTPPAPLQVHERQVTSSESPQGVRRSAATMAVDPQPDSQPTRISPSTLDKAPDFERPATAARSESLPTTERTLARTESRQQLPGFSDLPPLAREIDSSQPAREVIVEPRPVAAASSALTHESVAQFVTQERPTLLLKSESQADLTVPEILPRNDPQRGSVDALAATPRRMERSPQPAAEALEKPAEIPRQVLRVAQAPQSPREIPSRTLSSQSSDNGEPVVDAAPMALSQSQTGVAGVGETRNFSTLPRSQTGEAASAADFAQRTEPSQQSPPDNFMSPADITPLPRTPSRARISANSVAAVNAHVNSSSHSASVSQESLASAQLEPMASQARGDEGIGDVGSAPMDIGPPRYTGGGLARKSGGGGEPTVNPAPLSLPRATLRSGQVPRVAVPAAELATTAAAPQGVGGGSPSADALASHVQPDASTLGPDLSSATSPSAMLSQQQAGSAESMSPHPGPARRGGVSGGDGPTLVASVPRPLPKRTTPSGGTPAATNAETVTSSGMEISSGSERASSTGSEGARPLDTLLGRTDNQSQSPGDGEAGEQASGQENSPLTQSIATADPAEAVQAGSVPWDTLGDIGMAGLGGHLPNIPGIDDLRAEADGTAITLPNRRFTPAKGRMLPQTSSRVAVSADAFRQRFRRNPQGRANPPNGGPNTKTEAAIEAGLTYLAKIQLPDGHWELQSADATSKDAVAHDEPPSLRSNTAATGLALLAFLGAGYHHQDDPYRDVVRKGLDYLMAHQQDSGDFYRLEDETSNLSVGLYSHGIATLAMSEAFGMTQDPELKQAAQRGLDFIAAAQCESLGGWRYTPGNQSDTSVSGWMMMAIKSGELAGLEVPRQTYRRIADWLEQAQASEERPHLYRYNPYAPDTPQQRHGKFATPTMTSVGLLMRLYGGWRRDHPAMQAGARYLSENLPSSDSYGDTRRNTYYWYYATQVMFHMGGAHWKQWNDRLHPLLIDSQIVAGENAGSWHPRNPVPDRWGAQAGRLYVTTMNLLSLEVYYRHLPLYDGTLADSVSTENSPRN